MDSISLSSFCAKKSQTTKLNWFCYEFSNLFFDEIKMSPRLSLFRKKMGQPKIIAFCQAWTVSMAKDIKDVDQNQLMTFPRLEDNDFGLFLPNLTPSWTNALREASLKSWKEMTLACLMCRNDCIINQTQRAPLFNKLGNSGR
ncbi:MAG: hypothetical protein LBT86_03125 [Deltaproteobacteria bacterium]|jgi:hypothetical protein|nr:hypothetical protein [Deltaproteobacteria bacterium]